MLDGKKTIIVGIDLADLCNITDNCDLGTGKLSFTNSGYMNCSAVITTTDLGDPGDGNTIWINSNCDIEII